MTSTPVRNIEDSLELATLTPVSISGPLLQSPVLAPPAQAQERRKSGRFLRGRISSPAAQMSADSDDCSYFCIFSFLILVDQTSKIGGSYVFYFILKNALLARQLRLSVDRPVVACSHYIGRF